MSASSHLIELEGRWRLWKMVWLRCAGFPVSTVSVMTAPALAEAVRAVLAAEREQSAALDAAVERAATAFTANKTRENPLSKVLRALNKGRVDVDLTEISDDVANAIRTASAAAERTAALKTQLEALFGREYVRTVEASRKLARDPRLREALTWQNRAFVDTGLEPLEAQTDLSYTQTTRKRARVLARYLARYALKNDTIGFFGPTCWAGHDSEPSHLSSAAFDPAVTDRKVYFEFWAMDAVAKTLTVVPGLRPWLRPRRTPVVDFDGELLRGLPGGPARPDTARLRMLVACDGKLRAMDLVRELAARADSGIADEAAGYALLESLVTDKLVAWELEAPTALRRPELELEKQLDAVGDAAVRERCKEELRKLVSHREAISAAAGKPDELATAIRELGVEFQDVTGRDERQKEGETYAGRTLVYEDCSFESGIRFGAEFRRRLAAPLSLLLQSARWYTYEIGRRYYQAFEDIHRQLSEKTGQRAVEMLAYRGPVAALFPRERHDTSNPHPLGAEVRGGLHQRWAEALAIEPGARRVQRSAEALRPLFARLFEAPHPGWPTARWHSPDVMIAARDVNAFRAGDYQLVLGETHAGVNTFETPVALHGHPRPSEIVSALQADVGGRCAPHVSRERMNRTALTPLGPDVDRILFDLSPYRWDEDRTVPIASLVVDREDGRLVVRTRDGKKRWDVMQYYDYRIAVQSLAFFDLLPKAKHQPRVTVDDFVLSRESWRFDRAELPFLADSGAERMLGAARWREAHGIPSSVFVKVSGELKPFYVDLDSPMLVDSFANMAVEAQSVSVSEMLPRPDEVWLTDRSGATYTSELRIVAVDPEPWRAG